MKRQEPQKNTGNNSQAPARAVPERKERRDVIGAPTAMRARAIQEELRQNSTTFLAPTPRVESDEGLRHQGFGVVSTRLREIQAGQSGLAAEAQAAARDAEAASLALVRHLQAENDRGRQQAQSNAPSTLDEKHGAEEAAADAASLELARQLQIEADETESAFVIGLMQQNERRQALGRATSKSKQAVEEATQRAVAAAATEEADRLFVRDLQALEAEAATRAFLENERQQAPANVSPRLTYRFASPTPAPSRNAHDAEIAAALEAERLVTQVAQRAARAAQERQGAAEAARLQQQLDDEATQALIRQLQGGQR